MKFSLHYLKRYKDIAFLLAKYSEAGNRGRFGFDPPADASSNGQAKARDLPDDLERLGPTFVKLGQLLSSRADLLPEQFLKPLSRLQDKVKPFPYQDVEFIIENELGAKISKVVFLISIRLRSPPRLSARSIALPCTMAAASLSKSSGPTFTTRSAKISPRWRKSQKVLNRHAGIRPTPRAGKSSRRI